ncbi:MAG: ribonuclease R, partial [Deltaproteobacteria bacterium]|nr:ribonuclease R [Deltaproteobacteria bacterium]
MNPDRNKIIKFMQSTAKKPMSFRELSISFEISKKGRNSFKRLIFEMVENGELVKIRGGRYGLPSKMSIITGRLISHPDGYGFVVPDEEGEDIYIRRGRLRDAMHSDRVTVRIEGTKPDGKREGGIIKVIERAHKTLVGKLEKLRGGAFVIPSEERILYDIVVPVNQTMKAKGGELVTVEITRWPSKRAAPMGRVIEVLGDPEDPDVEAELITRKFGLVLKFPNTVQEAAEKIASTVQE